jgi:hypothetical protein
LQVLDANLGLLELLGGFERKVFDLSLKARVLLFKLDELFTLLKDDSLIFS